MSTPRLRTKEAREMVAKVVKAGGEWGLAKKNRVRITGPDGSICVSQCLSNGRSSNQLRANVYGRITRETGLKGL